MSGFGGNHLGTTYWLDNFVLDKPGGQTLKLQITPAAGTKLDGYSVALAGRRLAQLEETAAASKGQMLPLSVDVTDAAAVQDMVARTVARFSNRSLNTIE